ncbi:MAG: RNA-directed DNA polymerase [Sulfurovaceae bacterium]
MKNILSIKAKKAKKFFLKSESYINVDLPPYIKFNNLLSALSTNLSNKNYREIKKDNPHKLEKVNHKLLHNKNGKYDWRSFELIHPVLYVSLVNQITKDENWKKIKKRFRKIKRKSIVKCMSLPIISETQNSDKAKQILNWWEQVEQKSLELSLEFSYIYHTDITNCYGSIYTHSIPWAIHSKKVSKNNTRNTLIGNDIDEHIRAMSYGQTNGIPQGSVLMDFIAEIVLNYADLLLSKKISKKISEKEFKILRYRDDYRIFVNNPTTADEIIKTLTEILSNLGLKLHSQKTVNFNNVIQGSIKEDKIEWMMSLRRAKTVQKQLLIIHKFANKYPNSGTLTKELQNILNRINKETNKKRKLKYFLKKEKISVLVSIVVDIAYHNPRTYSISIAILSKLFSLINDESIILDVVNKMLKKFEDIPNTGHMQIWLQRAVIKIDNPKFKFNEKICKLVKAKGIKLWNNDWLHQNIITIIDNNPIINQDVIKEIDKIISNKEVLLFGEQSL